MSTGYASQNDDALHKKYYCPGKYSKDLDIMVFIYPAIQYNGKANNKAKNFCPQKRRNR